MANLQRRLKKLEAFLTDTAGLAAGSPRWWTYWTERVHKFMAGDDDVKDCKFPLEVVRAIIQAAEPASTADNDALKAL